MRRADHWPFCHSRQNKIIALCWTHRKHRLFPSKKAADKSLRAWKLWKERQGERVTKFDTGYRTADEGAFIHIYDFDSRRRLD
jgi:hypothetical protein